MLSAANTENLELVTEIALPCSYVVLLGKIAYLVRGSIPDQQETHPANNGYRIFRNVPTRDGIFTCKMLKVCFHLLQATHGTEDDRICGGAFFMTMWRSTVETPKR